VGVPHSNKVSDWLIREVDNHDIESFTPLAARFGQERFGYVVTPNADDLVRYCEDWAFREHYRGADHVLLDSRFAAFMLRIVKGVKLRVCSGSELTAALLSRVVTASDRVVLIGGSREEAQTLQGFGGLASVSHHEPPTGFANDPGALEECLRFIESQSPFRFCFLAVGSPRQEALAALLKARGVARGLALCMGASLSTGLYRFAQEAHRLAPWPRAKPRQAAARNAHAATSN
jgi:UDP-N-acetyl-D-mannosaminuronic acid transferase (WecB/TagA/CpsF family)